MNESDVTAMPDEDSRDRVQRLEDMSLANAMTLSQALPYLQALIVIVPTLTALILERHDIPRFAEDIAANADETTRAAIAQILAIDEAVH